MATNKVSNGCSYTNLWVSPSNWETVRSKKQLAKVWYIQCKFFDPLFKDKYPNGFPFRKRLNQYKTIEERQQAIRILKTEIPKLLDAGYNPITNYNPQEEIPKSGMMQPEMPVIDAFRAAHKKMRASEKHKNEVRIAINRVERGALELRMTDIPIKDFKRSQLRRLLDYLQLKDYTYNKFLSYLSGLFIELMEFDCCEVNITRDIRKRKTVKRLRETISLELFREISAHLKNEKYTFYRYMMIFFYSGARTTELFRLQKKDVNIEKQEYKVVIRKGREYREVIKIILPNALPFWKEVMSEAKHQDDFLFAKNLQPDSIAINPTQISRRWRFVKKQFSITADFYALKHLFLDELDQATTVEETIGIENISSKMASHTTPSITNSVYLVGKKRRENERLKKVVLNF